MKTLVLTLALLVSFASMAFAQTGGLLQNLSLGGGDTLNFYGRAQGDGYLESLKDNVLNNDRIWLYMKEARFGLKDHYDGITFDFQMALGGEEVSLSNGQVLTLLDMNADIPLFGSYFVKAGQFKVPFGREAMENSGFLMFNDRSIQYVASKVGRDVGAILHGNSGILTTTVGVVTGGGRDVPLRFLPEDLGCPMLVARVGLNDNFDQDNLDLRETNNGPSGYAIDIDGLYTRDSRIGHSTVLNVKGIDKDLLIDANYNPYIGIHPYSQGVYWKLGFDGGVRSTSNKTSYALEWELDQEGYQNDYGGLHNTCGQAQMSMRNETCGFGVRYAFYEPDQNFTYVSGANAYPIMGTTLVNELTLGAQWFLYNEHVKIGLDLPILFNAPVITEAGIGSYLLTEQPDQVSVLSGASHPTVVRETVIQVRAQVQYQFGL